MYCGSYEFEGRSPQYTSRSTQDTFLSLVYCGGAAVGVDALLDGPLFCGHREGFFYNFFAACNIEGSTLDTKNLNLKT